MKGGDALEARVRHFQRLLSNKWYYKYDYVLYELVLYFNKQKLMPGCLNDHWCFYDLANGEIKRQK